MNESITLANEKLAQLDALIGKAEFDAYLIISRQRSDLKFELIFDQNTENFAAALFTREHRHTLLVEAHEASRFEGLENIQVVTYENDFQAALNAVLDTCQIKKLGVNCSPTNCSCDGLSLGAYQLLFQRYKRETDNILVDAEALIDALRAIKSPAEIARIRECIKRVAECFEEVTPQICIGMSELEIGDLFIAAMRKRDLTASVGDPNGPPIVSNLRGGISHRGPGQTRLEPGDTLVVDFCAWYKGFSSDLSRTYYALRRDETAPDATAQWYFDLVYGNVSLLSSMMKPGVRGCDIKAAQLEREAALQSESPAGIPDYGIAAGHQIGRECHDGGTCLATTKRSAANAAPLQVGEVYALEPSCLLFDKGKGAHIEEDILITENGAEFLSERHQKIFLIPYSEV